MSNTIATAPAGPFSTRERALLAAFAAAVLPADDAFALPAASDPAILAAAHAILASRAREVVRALDALDAQADGAYVSAPEAERLAVAEAALHARAPGFGTLMTGVLQAYYQDDRVMVSLGMPPRPPFPQGYEVPSGDWSLLDPVRARAPFWRQVD